MHFAEQSATTKQKIHVDHPDMQMETYLMRGPDDQIYILHDTPFSKALSWVEYNPQNGKIAFVMDDGEIRDFGIPVDKKFTVMLSAQKMIAVALIENGKYVSGHNYPLIKYKV
jgi:hypothetical protein